MASKQNTAPIPPLAVTTPQWVFGIAAGLFFYVAIVKFGNAVILDSVFQAPTNAGEVLNESWPSKWGEWLSILLMIAAVPAIRWNRVKIHWVCALPALWLCWEMISAGHSIDPALTRQTTKHFAVCVFLFYLAYFAFQGKAPLFPLWVGIALALCWVIHAGMEQHFGGLAATRAMLQTPEGRAQLSSITLNNPDFAKRMASDRIFSTFMYPNTLAGGLILLLPLTLVFLWQSIPKVRFPGRVAIVGVFGFIGLACLYWSGSKAGWLVALGIGLIALGHSVLPRVWKRFLIYGVLVLGIAGFLAKYSAFFHKERNSVGARFGYWQAALRIMEKHPILGAGPGTFGILYNNLKRPDAEPTKLCHNDYLEQGCDSGVPGLVFYVTMVVLIMGMLYRYNISNKPTNYMRFAVWLGVLGLFFHSTVEFHLYIPALAWPQFFLLGWLVSDVK